MTISFAPLFGVLSLALGFGRKAADNNNWFLMGWFMF